MPAGMPNEKGVTQKAGDGAYTSSSSTAIAVLIGVALFLAILANLMMDTESRRGLMYPVLNFTMLVLVHTFNAFNCWVDMLLGLPNKLFY